jgi:hypothetical protein
MIQASLGGVQKAADIHECPIGVLPQRRDTSGELLTCEQFAGSDEKFIQSGYRF